MAFDVREAERRTKALVVYHSANGRTLQRAQDVARGLAQANMEPVLERVDGLTRHHIKEYRIIVFACKSVMGKPHPKIRTFFEGLPGGALHGKVCAVFASNGLFDARKAIETVEGWAAGKGAAVIKSDTTVSVLPSALLTQSRINAENEKCLRFGRMVGLLAQERCPEKLN